MGALGGLPRVGAEKGVRLPSSGPGSSDWPQAIGLRLSPPPFPPTRWRMEAPGREGAGRRGEGGRWGPEAGVGPERKPGAVRDRLGRPGSEAGAPPGRRGRERQGRAAAGGGCTPRGLAPRSLDVGGRGAERAQPLARAPSASRGTSSSRVGGGAEAAEGWGLLGGRLFRLWSHSSSPSSSRISPTVCSVFQVGACPTRAALELSLPF